MTRLELVARLSGKILILNAAFLAMHLHSAPAFQAEPAVPIQELDVKGLRRDFPRGKVDQPTVIASADELKRAFPEADVHDRLNKAVDFSKQKLLFFAWSGSGQDRLDPRIGKGDKGTLVEFTYQPGLTRDLRAHFRLFAIPRDASWRVIQQG